MTDKLKPVVLLILDGWGYREATEANAINSAKTPVWDRLWKEYPHTLIRTSGAAVGLPGGQMGNSEVGHLNLGAGRVVYQEFTRVGRSIRTGSFFNNQTLTSAVDAAVEKGKAVHILGLLSPGGVHSHEAHIHAMARLAVERGATRTYVHAFLDGRDTPPKSANASIRAMNDCFDELGHGSIASIIGRYYAMDRDHRWDRIEAAYDLLTRGEGIHQAESACRALRDAYAREETDEFVEATAIVPPGGTPVKIEDGDVVIFVNYRSDRARQLTQAFIDDDFDGFERKSRPKIHSFVSLTQYNKKFDIPVAFPPERLNNVFGEYMARLGMRQLRLAETEKYAHVTFFFNGGREEPFEGEDRILVPSPQVATYDLCPEMSAEEVTDHLVEAIEGGKYDAIICNYANTDMVGHTGKMEAAVQAIETIDHCLGRVQKALHRAGGEMLITADHGNAEQMEDFDHHQPHTAHTTNPVPLVYVGREAELEESGALCDIAPTMLKLMAVEQPTEMNGHPLVRFEAE
ncbi:2,3-bisphosphoglycerate-independent phosphoglycerate mutase [Candidatus Endoriftia persephone]|jgi:2,3-bisphosphoglycerate-independent phosphoglycerate mutase|uniref:2,3-bisphosphoglycerate-independent phosphoglycerate mutase n=3 Tax=Gammaproteobacteria TaxID=1236 RepID=G2FH43_9GAMM|nr:2,3-bisphosphoglycerate-independent phosphoglycerate mutase [Candidatus Endoriftia persephone]EGV50746.1 2,3-bisphosphoglycerate-independent phosphoglycerate mutase [endosymbiont of Riftia pachyptila (vent Ph05)]EGW53857.1 2,3-bisphosphoglycerate-independent phosphoglycerate mutase [endosymbiont of Tevnia jerichonana (vent Tica)]USF87707.1 2,3-bisphosphoglycerate-independent phosphoglycerate mutase [Candidatus Endoriftia persephone]